MSTIKSFTELGDIYTKSVLLSEANKNSDLQDPKNNKVGGKQEIGKVVLTKEGGDEKVKKDLQKPIEAKDGKKDGVMEEADKFSQPKVHKESKNMKSKSKFDNLCEDILKEDDTDLLGDKPEDNLESDVESGEKVEMDIESEKVDPAEIVKQLCELVTKLKDHFGICDDEHIEADVEVAHGEAVDAEVLGTPLENNLAGAKKLQDLKSFDKVGGTKVAAGKADAKITLPDAELKDATQGKKLAGNKDNKVKASGPVTGGGKSAFE
jgi:hypothetical protein